MKIGNIDLGERPLLLAPMEDVTDASFRLICKEMGVDMTYSEFVSADALVRNIAATTRKLEIKEAERPTAIQIYGRETEPMVEAARIVSEAHPDVIDINFGCPVKKVAGKGAGAGMLRNIPKMLEITRAVVDAVSLPVTVKTRLGWDCNNKIIVELAEQLQDCGIRALAVHGRTRSQMYTGEADWEMIARVKENPRLTIPVIGNGDITTPEKAREAFTRYGVDGVMVGRASIGCPWIFHDMRQALDSPARSRPSRWPSASACCAARLMRASSASTNTAASSTSAVTWPYRPSSKASPRSAKRASPCSAPTPRPSSWTSSTPPRNASAANP